MIYDSNDHYIDDLEASCHKMSLEVDELNNRISELENERDKLKAQVERFATIIATASPDKTGAMFICGVGGEFCKDGMREYVMICPTLGADGHAIYKKHTDYTAPGW
jgi:uncharacterized small protein (DUF1192 family)